MFARITTENPLIRKDRPMTHRQQLSIQQAAAIASVDPKTIRRRISDGSLPAHRIGPRLIRIFADDLAIFLAGRKLA